LINTIVKQYSDTGGRYQVSMIIYQIYRINDQIYLICDI